MFLSLVPKHIPALLDRPIEEVMNRNEVLLPEEDTDLIYNTNTYEIRVRHQDEYWD